MHLGCCARPWPSLQLPCHLTSHMAGVTFIAPPLPSNSTTPQRSHAGAGLGRNRTIASLCSTASHGRAAYWAPQAKWKNGVKIKSRK